MKRIMLWAAAGLVGAAAPAFAGTVVIVRSVGPSAKSFPPGKTLPDTSSISLQSGDAITLLGPSSSRTLRGPGKFTPGASGKASLAAAAGRRTRFGAMRTGEVAKNPSLWDLDVTQSGRMCVAGSSAVKLWRPEAAEAADVSVSGGGRSGKAKFAAGERTVAWPAAVPVGDGEYQVSLAGAAEASTMTLVTVSTPPADIQGAAQLLIEKDCQNQLDLLVANTAESD